MPDSGVVVPLAAGAKFVSLGRLIDLAAAEISDNPHDFSAATGLARIAEIHLAKIKTDPNGSSVVGRPAYFVRGVVGLELWPPCDKPYWFRATYRAPIKRGAPPQDAA